MDSPFDDDQLRRLIHRALIDAQAAHATEASVSESKHCFNPDNAEAQNRILRKARGELPLGRPPGYLPAREGSLAPAPQAWSLPRMGSLRGWLTIAACLTALLAGGAYVGRGVIVRIWNPSGEVKEFRVRSGERIEIIGGQNAGSAAPHNQPVAETQEWIVDDGDPAFSQHGRWEHGTVAGGYGGDYLYNERGGIEARWTFNVPAGTYEVFATWVAHPNRPASLIYYVDDNEQQLASYTVNQREPPGTTTAGRMSWRRLGRATSLSDRFTVRVDATTTRVDLTQESGNAICADAIRIVRVAE